MLKSYNDFVMLFG